MKSSNFGFSLAEKLAIVQALDSVIIADGNVHKGELNLLSRLMHYLDFESNFIVQARNIPGEQGVLILKEMTTEKKKSLVGILEDMAIADGFVHKKEMEVLETLFSKIGVLQEQ